MEEKALYVLAQFDEETQEYLSDCHRVLMEHGLEGNQTKNIPYHFTLGSFSVDREEALIGELRAICEKTHAFEIRMDHVGLFGLNVLFIEPNVNFELLNLQKSFFRDCGNGYHPWTAHATLLMDEKENIMKALPIINQNFKPFRATVESIGLYEFFPTRFIERCSLRPILPD